MKHVVRAGPRQQIPGGPFANRIVQVGGPVVPGRTLQSSRTLGEATLSVAFVAQEMVDRRARQVLDVQRSS
jgi:hypothetical protein